MSKYHQRHLTKMCSRQKTEKRWDSREDGGGLEPIKEIRKDKRTFGGAGKGFS